jgi:signal transduction histidine kinase
LTVEPRRLERARERVAADVTTGVQHPLDAALSSIERAQRSTQDSEATAALSIARAELRGVRDDLAALVAGVPAFDLGAGMLRQALDALALASPVPVEIRVSDYAAVDRQAEATLFYFCSEAVTNAVKHAAATRIRIEVRRAASGITAVVSDDGKGGANPTTAGSGLRGLQDRLASIQGRLQVESSPGAGTRLTAVMPLQRVRRFSAMASQ